MPATKNKKKISYQLAEKAAIRIVNLMKKRVAMKKNKIPYNDLSPKAKVAIKELIRRRMKRLKKISLGTSIGVTLGVIKITIDFARKPSFKEMAASIMGATIIVVTGAGLGFAVDARKIRKATNLVGKSLTQEALQNTKFSNMLETYRYVYVDMEGSIVLTNKPRLPLLGTIRLKSRDIQTGKWQLP